MFAINTRKPTINDSGRLSIQNKLMFVFILKTSGKSLNLYFVTRDQNP